MATDKERVSVYMDGDLKAKMKALAKIRKRSLNNLIELLCEDAIEQAIEKGELNVCEAHSPTSEQVGVSRTP